MKQILNIDSDSFSATILQDVQEIRIQESDQFENSVHSHSQKEESLDCPTYFEYSMGGNLKFYKEHLQQDFEMENHVYSTKNQRQRLRKSSHSDNDSEPEALRYAHKAQEKVVPAVNTISEEPELSFDDYSSIYQPEFMLNINSKSLVKEMPKHGLGDNKERAKGKEIMDKVKNNEHKIASWSQNFVGDSSPENVAENLEVHIISKSNNQPAVKQNILSKSHEQMFDYHSPLVKTKRNGKQLENKELEPVHDKSKGMKSVENKSGENEGMKSVKSRGNQETMSVKRDQNKTKNKMTNLKPRQPKTIQSSTESNVGVKNISSNDHPSLKRKKIVNNMTPPLLKKTESKKDSKDGLKKATERRKTSKNLIPKMESNSDVSRFYEENSLPCAANNQRSVKPQENFLSMLNIDTTTMFDNTDLFEELEMTTEKMLSEPKRNKDAEFYPESPISELHFFKTPCSTRHNSLETFEQLESECIEGCVEVRSLYDLFLTILLIRFIVKFVCATLLAVSNAMLFSYCRKKKSHQKTRRIFP